MKKMLLMFACVLMALGGNAQKRAVAVEVEKEMPLLYYYVGNLVNVAVEGYADKDLVLSMPKEMGTVERSKKSGQYVVRLNEELQENSWVKLDIGVRQGRKVKTIDTRQFVARYPKLKVSLNAKWVSLDGSRSISEHHYGSTKDSIDMLLFYEKEPLEIEENIYDNNGNVVSKERVQYRMDSTWYVEVSLDVDGAKLADDAASLISSKVFNRCEFVIEFANSIGGYDYTGLSSGNRFYFTPEIRRQFQLMFDYGMEEECIFVYATLGSLRLNHFGIGKFPIKRGVRKDIVDIDE